MIKFALRSIAFLITSIVANMVVAIPVTTVSLFPDFNVSTVCANGAPGTSLMNRSMICTTVQSLGRTFASVIIVLEIRTADPTTFVADEINVRRLRFLRLISGMVDARVEDKKLQGFILLPVSARSTRRRKLHGPVRDGRVIHSRDESDFSRWRSCACNSGKQIHLRFALAIRCCVEGTLLNDVVSVFGYAEGVIDGLVYLVYADGFLNCFTRPFISCLAIRISRLDTSTEHED